MSFFRYHTEISETMAKDYAKENRQQVVTNLVSDYNQLLVIYNKSKDSELEILLIAFHAYLVNINQYQNDTVEFQSFLEQQLSKFENRTDIRANIDNSIWRLNEHHKIAISRPKTIAKNQHLRIQHHATYWAAISVAIMCAGAIVACMNPIGLGILGVGLGLLVISHLIYRYRNYQRYQELAAQIKDDKFTPDLYTGNEQYAIDPNKLPKLPNHRPEPKVHKQAPSHQQAPTASKKIQDINDDDLDKAFQKSYDKITESTQLLADTVQNVTSNVTSMWYSPEVQGQVSSIQNGVSSLMNNIWGHTKTS